VGVALAVSAASCRGEQAHRGPPTWEPPLAAHPVDALAPGELAEGAELAFGVPLPRVMVVERRFYDAVFATGSVSAEHLVNYLRKRFTVGSTQTGPAKTFLSEVTPKVPGSDAGSVVLRIEVTSRGSATDLIIKDVTPPPVEQGLTEEERWRRHGLTKDGQVLDPTKLE
jgi:hypothetical protein